MLRLVQSTGSSFRRVLVILTCRQKCRLDLLLKYSVAATIFQIQACRGMRKPQCNFSPRETRTRIRFFNKKRKILYLVFIFRVGPAICLTPA